MGKNESDVSFIPENSEGNFLRQNRKFVTNHSRHF